MDKEETYLDRLEREYTELEERINKLSDALYAGRVPKSEIYILNIQMSAMGTYREILEYRLKK